MKVVRVLAATLVSAFILTPALAEPAAGEGSPQTPAVINSSTVKPAGLITVPPNGAPPAAEPAPADAPAFKSEIAAKPADTAAPVPAASSDAAESGTNLPPATAEAGTTDAVTAVAAPAEPPPPPEPTLVININLSTQRMTVSEDGVSKHTWPISSAAPGYLTPTGTFKPSWMTKMWYSRQYDMSPMPHSIFFKGGVAIHATQAIRYLGQPASHGCVRLAPSNAATLYKIVSKHGKSMTKIVVHGSPKYRVSSRRYSTRTAYGYGQTQQRPLPAAYGFYGTQPSYYVPAPKRRYGKAPSKPKYVSRGLFSQY